jgi:hypothetical protein
MKHLDRVLVNTVVHDFQQPPLGISGLVSPTQDQIFVQVALQKILVEGMGYDPTDIRFTDGMIKRRGNELNVLVHSFSLAQPRLFVKPGLAIR